MIIAFVLLAIGSASSVVSIDSGKRVKKIVNGRPLGSMDTYSTYYYISLRQTWACDVAADDHEAGLFGCQEQVKCSGTLIHPEFVLTSGSCVMYYEVKMLRYGGETDMEKVEEQAEKEDEGT